jgi:hypothetical protein
MWQPFYEALIEAGIIEPDGMTKSVVIRADAGGVVTVTLTKFFDGSGIDVITGALMIPEGMAPEDAEAWRALHGRRTPAYEDSPVPLPHEVDGKS